MRFIGEETEKMLDGQKKGFEKCKEEEERCLQKTLRVGVKKSQGNQAVVSIRRVYHQLGGCLEGAKCRAVIGRISTSDSD